MQVKNATKVTLAAKNVTKTLEAPKNATLAAKNATKNATLAATKKQLKPLSEYFKNA